MRERVLVGERVSQTSVAAAAAANPIFGSPHRACVVALNATVQRTAHASVFWLLVFNVALQLFDGVATYAGLHLGVQEGNPLLRDAFAFWGLGAGLLLIKGHACGLLLVLYRFAGEQLVVVALGLLASVYTVCSLLPWLGVFAFIIFRLS